MAGRKPEPTALKLIKGNPGKRPLNKLEPVVTSNVSDEAPEWMTPRQAEDWKYHLSNCPSGMVKTLDRNTLAHYIVAHDHWMDCVAKVRAFGLTVMSPNGYPMTSPYSTDLKKYSVLTLRLAAELGFTPSSRSKISLDPEQIENDPWAKMAAGM